MDFCKNCYKSKPINSKEVFCIRHQCIMKNFDDCNKNISTKQLIENVKESSICQYGII